MSLSTKPPISATAPARASVLDWLRARARLAVSIVTCLLVVLIANADGGYFATSWGWCVLVFTWIAGLCLIFAARIALGRLELAFLAALALLTAWIALSILWSSNPERSVLEVQRVTVYLSAVAALVLAVRAHAVAHLVGGLVAGATWVSAQALASRLFPDAPSGLETILQARLNGPISYSNGLGVFAVMGALLALAIAVHAQRLSSRVAAACTLPLLLATTYFTFSRGAGVALAIGLRAAVAFDGGRLKLLTAGVLVAAPAAAAVWLASSTSALTKSTESVVRIADEGREFAIALLALTVASAVIALALGAMEHRIRVPTVVRRGYATVLALAALVAVGGFVIDQGGPGPLVKRAYQNVNKDKLPASQAEANDLNTRLLSIGTTPRVNFWRVALRQHDEHPWLGSGAGTYQQFWLREREAAEHATDGHGVYLEMLGELGWPGLAFVVTLLALPLAAVMRARRRQPLLAGAAGAYAAFLFHVGVDWDWELPSVTLFALACGVALIAAARDDPAARSTAGPRARAAGLAACAAIAVFAIVGLFGNRALADVTRELALRDYADARTSAQLAVKWAPWSAQAHRQLGRAQAGLGRKGAGRASLAKAARMSSADWRIWYDLGILSSGSQRQRAFLRAAALNPLQKEIAALRKRGYRLPRAPTTR